MYNATRDNLAYLNLSMFSSETMSVINFNGTDETIVGVKCHSYNQLRNSIESELLQIVRKLYIKLCYTQRLSKTFSCCLPI